MADKSGRSQAMAIALFLVSFLGLVCVRLYLVTLQIGQYTGCSYNCFSQAIFANDAIILAVLLLLMVTPHFGMKYTNRPLVLIGVLLLFAYLADLFIMLVLSHRLNISDVIKYAGDVKINSTVVAPIIFSKTGSALLFLGLCCIFSFAYIAAKSVRKIKTGIALLATSMFLAIPQVIPQDIGHISQNTLDNIIVHNLPNGENQEYSATFKNDLKKINEVGSICEPAQDKPRPVILLVVESLSVYQSNYLSGLYNYTPELDSLAQKYNYLDEFYANGFTTDGGLISLLTGHPPIPGVNRYNSTHAYTGFDEIEHKSLRKLAEIGYDLAYFTSADLEFIDTVDWLKKIGFSYIEGPEHSYYNGMPRGSFNDPGDHALYQRFLGWLDQKPKNENFFAVVQTITTHPPFIVPGTSAKGEEAAVRYADKNIGLFVRELEKRGFFGQGLLFITGDHRSMTMRRPGEWEKYGKSAIARVPGIIVGNHGVPKGKIPGRWQQTDFIPSLLYASGIESCTSDFQGRFLGRQMPAKFIMHAQGIDRDRVLVRIKNDEIAHEVQLDGDKTRWLGKAPMGEHQAVIDEINHERAFRPNAPADLVSGLLRWYGLSAPTGSK